MRARLPRARVCVCVCVCVRAGAAPVCVNTKNQYRPRAAPFEPRRDDHSVEAAYIYLHTNTHMTHGTVYIYIYINVIGTRIYYYVRITSTSVEMTQL